MTTTTTTEINQATVLETARAVVAEYGSDYVNEKNPLDSSCYYAVPNNDGEPEPSCFVGHIVCRLAPEVFKQYAKYEAHMYASAGADKILVGLSYDHAALADDGYSIKVEDVEIRPFTQDERIIRALQRAQVTQDRGATWGEALTELELALGVING